MKINSIHWMDTNDSSTRAILLQDTEVKGVDRAASDLVEALAAYSGVTRERQAAYAARDRLGDEARVEAVNAGARGLKADRKSLKKKRALAEEVLEDRELAWLEAGGRLSQLHAEYLVAVTHHAPALREAARQVTENSMLELASARQIASRAASNLESSILIMGDLNAVLEGRHGGGAVQVPREPGDDISDGGHPAAWAAQSDEPLVRAIGWTARHLDHFTAMQAERAEAAKVAAREAAAAAEAEAAALTAAEADAAEDD